jgi:hypothetical protein
MRLVDVMPYVPVLLDYETLVHIVEANFYQKHNTSGEICKLYTFYLPHAVLNPEGSGKHFSHFIAPGYYVHIMPLDRLEALAIDDNFRIQKKARLIDPSGKLSVPDLEAEGMRLISAKSGVPVKAPASQGLVGKAAGSGKAPPRQWEPRPQLCHVTELLRRPGHLQKQILE